MSSSGTYQTCLTELGSTSPDPQDLIECVSIKYDSTNSSTHAAVDVFFLLYAASLVFFMQAGFAMICAGCVRLNNVQNTLLKNLLDACGASLGFYSVGYAFAWGGSIDPYTATKTFIGKENFFLGGVENDSFWLFQYAFSATSATIIAGTLAERCQMVAYLCYSLALSSFVYPVVVHSIWSPSGFLSANNAVDPLWGVGMVDFAGSCVVHLTGGMTALIATIVLGPRTGRFYDNRGNPLETPKEFPGHSLGLQMLGVFILWFGWYGFNAGSIISLTLEDNYMVVSHTVIGTTLAGAAGCVMTLFLHTVVVEHMTGEITFNLQYAMNGCLSGLVAITAGCSIVESWAAILIGLVAGALYLVGTKLMVNRRIDDAVDAIPVHMVNGIWGSLSVGLFAEPRLMEIVYGTSKHVGWFYSWARGSGDATLLACQLVGILFVIGWVTVTMAPFFWMLHYLGWLRADSLEEVVGLDIGYTGGLLHKRAEINENIDEYVDQYLKRKQERGELRRSRSGLSLSLHGNSRHGGSRSIETLDVNNNSAQNPESSADLNNLDISATSGEPA